MKVRNFTLILDGSWQPIPTYLSFMGLQIQNPVGNSSVSYRFASGVDLILTAGETYELITPKPNNEPILNDLEIKGTSGETINGEFWLYDYQ